MTNVDFSQDDPLCPARFEFAELTRADNDTLATQFAPGLVKFHRPP